MSTVLEYTEPLVQAIADSSHAHREWLRRGQELALADEAHQTAHQFQIGDWLMEGEKTWSRRAYASATRIFPKRHKETLYTLAYVARHVETSIRIKDLSWAHHRVVASFNRDTQQELLEHAANTRVALAGFKRYIDDNYRTIKPAADPEMTSPEPESSESGSNSDWKDHWQGMPEFIQNQLPPFKSLVVHFESQEDVDKFAAIVGQGIMAKTRYIWYPKKEHSCWEDKRYVDANEEGTREVAG